MIKKFEIKNFKSHENTDLEFSNITILTGMNGMGKSSVIQALLLLRQSYLKSMLHLGLELNSDLCSIGVAKDAIYQYATVDNIIFKLWTDNFIRRWDFIVDNRKLDATFINNSDLDIEYEDEEDKENSIIEETKSLKEQCLFDNNFQYISAFRNGPVKDYDRNTSAVEIFNQISGKEGRCEWLAHYLDFHKNLKVNEHLIHHEESSPELMYQVQFWMQSISPDINIHLELNGANYKLKYSFGRGEHNTTTDKFEAMNVGFGISYVLPIVVATLSAKPGSLIIIENPESHIHPSAQSKLMELISKAAKTGVQFIIETHSDHIINGLLVALKFGLILPEETSIYYFDKEITRQTTQSYKINVSSNCRIKNAPEGFFDQFGKDLRILMQTKKT